MRVSLGGLVAGPVLALLAGCAATHQVRYVYQDGEFGVIGMPENTDRWPTHYQRQAEKLMARHFPQGHEIVRAEEVVEGSRTLTTQGSTAAELLPQLPTAALSVGKLGRSASRSQADQLKIKECRIVYRRSDRTAPPALFAERATLSPTKYVDPNDLEQRKDAGAQAGTWTQEPKLETAVPAAGSVEAPAAAATQAAARRFEERGVTAPDD